MNIRIKVFFFLTAFLVMLFLPAVFLDYDIHAAGQKIFVNATEPGTDCSQADPCWPADGLAKALDGDTIYFAAGTYTGSTGDPVLMVTKGVTLIGGWDGAATGKVIIDPDEYETVIDGEGGRGLIEVDSASDVYDVSIIGFTLMYGRSPVGGAIKVNDGKTIIENNAIKNNDSTSYGGGIYAQAEDGLVIRNNLFLENYTTYGGAGIYITRESEPEVALIENNHFLANFTGDDGYGGAIGIEDSAVIINANRIANTMIASSTILVTSEQLVQITNNIIWWDTFAITNPAAINIWYKAGETTEVINNTIVNSKVGIEDTLTAMANISNNIFYNCGKSIDLETDSNFTGTNNLFYENDTDPLFLDNPIIDESPLFVDKDNYDYHITKDSPAVDAGAVVALSFDFDGDARPIGKGYDIGADEFIVINYLPLIMR